MTYLWPWIDAVNAGITCIMCVMNRVNDTQGCQNYHILTELLKGELNYQGARFGADLWKAVQLANK